MSASQDGGSVVRESGSFPRPHGFSTCMPGQGAAPGRAPDDRRERSPVSGEERRTELTAGRASTPRSRSSSYRGDDEKDPE